jgi:hypothetical protein
LSYGSDDDWLISKPNPFRLTAKRISREDAKDAGKAKIIEIRAP